MSSDPREDATAPLEGLTDPTVPGGPAGAKRAALGGDDTVRQDDTRPMPADAPKVRVRPSQPTRLGRYTIVKLLGSGGMGEVYRGYDNELDRGVAIKVLRRDRDMDSLTEGLRREAQALAKLVHPNVLTVHDVGFDNGQLFVVMQLIEGESIDTWLHGASPARIVAAFRDAGRGLAAAHAAELVHCDFKPANVLVDRDGVVRVSDFGLARMGAEASHTLAGTPRYMAPEQFGGVATAASDQYSFCVSLWEVLAGEPPFPDTPIDDVQAANARTRPEIPGTARVPGYVARALVRGLSTDPKDRFPSMDALLEALAPPAWRRWAIGGALVAGAVGIAIIATFALATPAAKAPEDAPAEPPLTTAAPLAITDLGTSVSACAPTVDGDHVVFSRSQHDAVDLYTVPLAGGVPKQLTTAPTWEWRSNPGRHAGEVIHLVHDPANFENGQVAYLDTATSRETTAAKVLTGDAGALDTGIVYLSADGRDLRRIVGDRDVVLVHAPDGHVFHFLATSHHRDRVVAIAEAQTGRQLCIADVKTGTHECAPTKAFPTRPAFGADDRTLYYNAGDGIHRRVLATGDDSLVVADVVSKGGLAVSDDGRALVYSDCGARQQLVDWTDQQVLVDDRDASTPSGTSTNHLVWVRWLRGKPVLIARLDGAETQLTQAQFGPISEPAMSPSGNVVAFRSGPPHPGIYTMPIRSGADIQKISDDEHDRHPVWIGDDMLAFTRTGDDRIPTVYTAASDGAMLKALPGAGRTAVSGRDHHLLVATRWKLYSIDLATGRERPGPVLDPSITNNSLLVTSPDGRWLAIMSGTDGHVLNRMHLDPPGVPEPLVQLPSGETVEGKPAITNDGHVILAPETWSGNVHVVRAKTGRF